MLRNDPQTQGPRLFEMYSLTLAIAARTKKARASSARGSGRLRAPYGFASRDWIARVLDPKHVAGPDMFGHTKHKAGDMVTFVKDDLPSKDAAEVKARDRSVGAGRLARPSRGRQERRRRDQGWQETVRVAVVCRSAKFD